MENDKYDELKISRSDYIAVSSKFKCLELISSLLNKAKYKLKMFVTR